jgi:ATP-dependent exoDNAse (exonuclease V) beta subunit
VLYVAMTRARERLVLSGSATARRAGSSWADTVFGQLGIVAPPQAPQLLSWADGVRVAPLPVAPPVP